MNTISPDRATDPSQNSAPGQNASGQDSAPGPAAELEPVRFDSKISILLREDLETWQRLNVCAFLSSGIAAAHPELIGEPYQDADGIQYLAMFRQPVLVLIGSKELFGRAHQRALGRELPISLFTADLFTTGHDRSNRAAVRAVATEQLDLVGMAVHGPRNAVDKVFKGARMHP